METASSLIATIVRKLPSAERELLAAFLQEMDNSDHAIRAEVEELSSKMKELKTALAKGQKGKFCRHCGKRI